MQNIQDAVLAHKDKALSFIQEFSRVAGTGIALTMAYDLSTKVYPLPTGDLDALMNGVKTGTLFYVGAAHIIPLFANWSDATSQNKEPSIEHYFPEHTHTPMRLAGIAAGTVLSLAVIWNTLGDHHRQIDFSAVGQQVAQTAGATLSDLNKAAAPAWDIVAAALS